VTELSRLETVLVAIDCLSSFRDGHGHDTWLSYESFTSEELVLQSPMVPPV